MISANYFDGALLGIVLGMLILPAMVFTGFCLESLAKRIRGR
jgi:sulfite exporter TauE/SafE